MSKDTSTNVIPAKAGIQKLIKLMTCLLALFAFACRERAHINPEDIVLDDTTIGTALVETTIGGTVACSTCQDAASMLIEVYVVDSPSLAPMLQTPFDKAGAYQVTVKVAAKTKLRIVARVFAPGGIILGEQQVEVPEGEAAVALAVNFAVP